MPAGCGSYAGVRVRNGIGDGWMVKYTSYSLKLARSNHTYMCFIV